jgi:hypothetical protein
MVWWLSSLNVQTDRQTDRRTVRQTDVQSDRQTYRQTDVQTDRRTDRQTYRQTDRLTDRQTYRQTYRHNLSLRCTLQRGDTTKRSVFSKKFSLSLLH